LFYIDFKKFSLNKIQLPLFVSISLLLIIF